MASGLHAEPETEPRAWSNVQTVENLKSEASDIIRAWLVESSIKVVGVGIKKGDSSLNPSSTTENILDTSTINAFTT